MWVVCPWPCWAIVISVQTLLNIQPLCRYMDSLHISSYFTHTFTPIIHLYTWFIITKVEIQFNSFIFVWWNLLFLCFSLAPVVGAWWQEPTPDTSNMTRALQNKYSSVLLRSKYMGHNIFSKTQISNRPNSFLKSLLLKSILFQILLS